MTRVKIFFILFFLTAVNLYSLDIDEATYNLGLRLFNQKQYQESLRELNQLMDKYPESRFFNKALLSAAKILALSGKYELAIVNYQKLSRKAGNSIEKRQAVYGIAECNYKIKNWQEAASGYIDFAVQYKDSPARASALYYAGKSMEELHLQSNAMVLYHTLALEYPNSPYVTDACRVSSRPAVETNRLTASAVVHTNIVTVTVTNSVRDNGSKEPSNTNYSRFTTNMMVVTNIVFQTNQNTQYFTNLMEISNFMVITQTVTEIDSNDLVLHDMEQDRQKKQEELERYRALIELKAKFLEMKEKAIREKNETIINPND